MTQAAGRRQLLDTNIKAGANSTDVMHKYSHLSRYLVGWTLKEHSYIDDRNLSQLFDTW